MDNKKFKELMEYISGRFDRIEEILNIKKVSKRELDGEEIIDNQDLCNFLGVTKRTLQRYRNRKLIPFYKIDGKMYYKKSEILEFFKNHDQRRKNPPEDT